MALAEEERVLAEQQLSYEVPLWGESNSDVSNDLSINDSDETNYVINLRELFYDRNPGDARVKVGSERQAARSSSSQKVAQDEIHGYHMGLSPTDTSKFARNAAPATRIDKQP